MFDKVANDVVHGLAQNILVAQDALDGQGDPTKTLCSLPMLGFEIADDRDLKRIARFELFDDQVLFWMMAGIRIIHEVVDGRADDLVIRAIATLKYA